MSKAMITVSFAEIRYDVDGCTLKEVFTKIENWIKIYGENVIFEIEDIGGDSCINLVGKREETDVEYARRILDELKQKELQKKCVQRFIG